MLRNEVCNAVGQHNLEPGHHFTLVNEVLARATQNLSLSAHSSVSVSCAAKALQGKALELYPLMLLGKFCSSKWVRSDGSLSLNPLKFMMVVMGSRKSFIN
ncbi:hypothetical protein TW84_02995 [Vibrio neptunius]|uniref:hypothetical protein n=1 Tax=Vibrio neptunius TaxID=170651 RepID=UPI0005FA5FE9|nr:hypothetical protein [Vibrio neptunius]KJY93589.1 hypothetical protein TW84_02995 [Vibrio neptunius]